MIALATAACTGVPALKGTLLLLAAVAIYNFAAKKSAVLGPLIMGLCRALSVLLGALALDLPPSPLLIALPPEATDAHPLLLKILTHADAMATHIPGGRSRCLPRPSSASTSCA